MNKIATFIRQIIITIIDWLYIPPLRFIPKETFRYGATGGANTLLDIFLYFIFYNYIFDKQNFDLYFITISPHIAAFLAVFPITFITGFLLAKYITFTDSHLKSRTQLMRYMLTVLGSILLNYLLLKLFVEGFGWYATISKIVTTCIVVLYSYIAQKYFSFRKNKK